MKKMICEKCGSTDFVKGNGYFVCKECGAQYSLDEMNNIDSEDKGSPNLADPKSLDISTSISNALKLSKEQERIKFQYDLYCWNDYYNKLEVARKRSKPTYYRVKELNKSKINSILQNEIEGRIKDNPFIAKTRSDYKWEYEKVSNRVELVNNKIDATYEHCKNLIIDNADYIMNNRLIIKIIYIASFILSIILGALAFIPSIASPLGVAFIPLMIAIFAFLWNKNSNHYQFSDETPRPQRFVLNAKISDDLVANMVAKKLLGCSVEVAVHKEYLSYEAKYKEIVEKVNNYNSKLPEIIKKMDEDYKKLKSMNKELEKLSIPKDYTSRESIASLMILCINKRADNVKEAINLLEEEKFRSDVLRGFDSLGAKLDFIGKNLSLISGQITVLNNEIHKLDLHMSSIKAEISETQEIMTDKFIEQVKLNKNIIDTMADVSNKIEQSNDSLKYLRPEFKGLS